MSGPSESPYRLRERLDQLHKIKLSLDDRAVAIQAETIAAEHPQLVAWAIAVLLAEAALAPEKDTENQLLRMRVIRLQEELASRQAGTTASNEIESTAPPCWLIESTYVTPRYPPKYWSGNRVADWSERPDEAVYFAREEDAYRIINWLGIENSTQPVEHVWRTEERPAPGPDESYQLLDQRPSKKKGPRRTL